MPKLKLTYFDFHGGRGEPARLALSLAGIPFEDDRVLGTDWPRRKPSTPFGSLPVLEVDGAIVTQSNGINRYVGKLADLYPSDPWQAALCDEAMEAVEDITSKVSATFSLPEDQKKAQRQALADGPITFFSHAFSNASRPAAVNTSPAVGSASPTSRSSFGSATSGPASSTTFQPICPIASRPSSSRISSASRTIPA